MQQQVSGTMRDVYNESLAKLAFSWVELDAAVRVHVCRTYPLEDSEVRCESVASADVESVPSVWVASLDTPVDRSTVVPLSTHRLVPTDTVEKYSEIHYL